MFQPKTFYEIVADMVEHARGSTDLVTDYNVGSIARTMLEAEGVALEDYYLAVTQALQEAIPSALYKAFDITALPAAVARGRIRITISDSASEFTLPAGTRASTAGGEVDFVTTEALVFAAHQTVGEVPAVALQVGVVGNVPANTITLLPNSSLDVLSVTNPLAFTLGSDSETEQQMKARFIAFVSALSRATPPALEYAARAQRIYNEDGTIYESVQRVAIQEFAGYVRIFIYNGAGNTSNALIDKVQAVVDGYFDPDSETYIPGYRAAGVFVSVGGMLEKSVSITVQATLLPGYGQTAAMESAIRMAAEYAIRNAPSGKTLTVSKLQNAVLSAPGVQDVLIVPAASISCAANEALVPGTITVVMS